MPLPQADPGSALESKGKNCRDDEAVNLLVLEELLDILTPPDAASAGEGQSLEQEEAMDEAEADLDNDLEVLEETLEEEEEQQFNLQDLRRPVPQDTQNVLTGMASSKLAAPIVENLVTQLKCPECNAILQTEPEFPLHIHHTITSEPSQLFKHQASQQVAAVVQQMNTKALERVQPFYNLPGILKRFLHTANNLQAVKSFQLCEQHRPSREFFLHNLALKILTKDLKRKNTAYKESKSRSLRNVENEESVDGIRNMDSSEIPRKSTKYQRVSHL